MTEASPARLGIQVLAQALHDAIATSRRRAGEVMHARRWLLAPRFAQERRFWCDVIGVREHELRRAAERVIRSGRFSMEAIRRG